MEYKVVAFSQFLCNYFSMIVFSKNFSKGFLLINLVRSPVHKTNVHLGLLVICRNLLTPILLNADASSIEMVIFSHTGTVIFSLESVVLLSVSFLIIFPKSKKIPPNVYSLINIERLCFLLIVPAYPTHIKILTLLLRIVDYQYSTQ